MGEWYKNITTGVYRWDILDIIPIVGGSMYDGRTRRIIWLDK